MQRVVYKPMDTENDMSRDKQERRLGRRDAEEEMRRRRSFTFAVSDTVLKIRKQVRSHKATRAEKEEFDDAHRGMVAPVSQRSMISASPRRRSRKGGEARPGYDPRHAAATLCRPSIRPSRRQQQQRRRRRCATERSSAVLEWQPSIRDL